jgi:hypothetical protein
MPEEQQLKALANYIRVARARGFHVTWAKKCWEWKFGKRVTPAMLAQARRMA